MKRYFVSIYTDGPATLWNVIDRQTQEWVRRFPTKETAEAYAAELEKKESRLWLRRKDQIDSKTYAVHEFDGSDTTCLAVRLKGMIVENYQVTGAVRAGERVCQACQTGIAERRGKF